MNYILFEDDQYKSFLPLTFTRPTSNLRCGIFTLDEKWAKHLKQSVSHLSRPYLQEKFQSNTKSTENILINGRYFPNTGLISEINSLQIDQVLVNQSGEAIALKLDHNQISIEEISNIIGKCEKVPSKCESISLNQVTDLFTLNGWAIEQDINLIEQTNNAISSTNTIIGDPNKIFIGSNVKIEGATLNTTNGPIYIGEEAEIMEGSLVRGPFALCEHSVLKLGAKIYGPTTIGPYSKVGGEVNNSVIQGYSNKGHDGFIGNTVIGEWCNLGADTNTSNLKNNYANVRLWNYESERFADTGLQFCGLIMGDHSKCGINTMFNTGTIVGVSANIFGSGFPRNFVPSFTWGGAQGFTTYKIEKSFEVAEKVMERRNKQLNETEKNILQSIFDNTQKYRIWEKQKVAVS